MAEGTLTDGGLPISAEDPAEVRPTALFRGSWCQDGGMVAKRADFALLQSRTGITVYVDRRAVELAAFALGLTVTEPPAPRPSVVCAFGGGVIFEGSPDAKEPRAVSICPCCRRREVAAFPREGRTAEIGR